MNQDFEVKRTELANEFATAGAALLSHMNCAAAVAAIPGGAEEYAIAGTIRSIIALANTVDSSALATQAQEAAPATDLHNAIMNLPSKHAEDFYATTSLAYKCGHRDARHAAAELALAHPAAAVEPKTGNQQLRTALEGLHRVCQLALAGKDGTQYANFESRAGHFVKASDAMQAAENALAGAALVEPVAIPAGWISVEIALPERECLAVYVTPNGKQRLIRAKYARQFQIEAEGDDCETEYNDDDDTFYIKAGWLECIDNWGEYSSCYVTEGTVTHWTPLPALPGAAAPAAEGGSASDPMDWPLPCDVKVGSCTIRKGCKLRTLVTRMESLHRMAMKAIPEPTPEARAMVDAMLAGTWEADATGAAPSEQLAAPEQTHDSKVADLVDAIIADLEDRKGIFADVDEDVMEEICDALTVIVKDSGAFAAPTEPQGAARNAVLEEAAKVAEETDVATFTHAQVLHDDGSKTRSDIAAAIRALKGASNEGGADHE